VKFLGKLFAKAANAAGKVRKAVKASRAAKAVRSLKEVLRVTKGVRGPIQEAGKLGYAASQGFALQLDGAPVRGRARQEYEDGTWETDEEVDNRVKTEKAQQAEFERQQQQQLDREASEKRTRDAAEAWGYEREISRIRDATPAERTRMDVERDLMDPDYEINHRRELELSEFDAQVLVSQREARLNAMPKGGRSAGAKRRSRRKKAGAVVVAGAGMFGALNQCTSNEEPAPVETVTQATVASDDVLEEIFEEPAPFFGEEEVFEDPAGAGPDAVDESADPEDTGDLNTPEGETDTGTDVTGTADASTTTLDGPTNTEASPTTATTTTAASTTTTTASPTTTTATTTTVATTTTTAAPAVNPIAGAQGSTVLCNTGDLSAIAITQSFKMRDFVTGEDLVDHFDGVQATMSLSGGAGTTSQDTSTVVGALVTFNFVLSQPMRPTERLIPSLQVGGVSVPVSVNSIGYSTGVCTF